MRTYVLVCDGLTVHTGTYDECHAYVRANVKDMRMVKDVRMRPLTTQLTSTSPSDIREHFVKRPATIRVEFGKRRPSR